MENKYLKLTNTVYKVLDFFPESDPLKHRAKDKALEIMEYLLLINEPESPSSRGHDSILKIKTRLSEDIGILLGYLWIGKTQGWLNSVNCMIISSEYEKIKQEIEPSMELTQKLPGLGGLLSIEKNSQKEPEQLPSLELNSVESKVPDSHISARQEKIVEFLNKNAKAQVMDLQKILPNITKRTIRRDLDELLGLGRIIRQGDFNQVSYQIKR